VPFFLRDFVGGHAPKSMSLEKPMCTLLGRTGKKVRQVLLFSFNNQLID
jgi:hypothetical protein